LTKCFTYTLRVCDQRTTDCGIFSCQRARGPGRLADGPQNLCSWSPSLNFARRLACQP
jgi:hypothetical protein